MFSKEKTWLELRKVCQNTIRYVSLHSDELPQDIQGEEEVNHYEWDTHYLLMQHLALALGTRNHK